MFMPGGGHRSGLDSGEGAAGLAYKWVLGLGCEVGTVLGVSAGDERAPGPELA
jgi:hypothetical protein